MDSIRAREETRGLPLWVAAEKGNSSVAKGGEKMAKIPAWLLLILNFLLSDLFDQLVEWAKDIVENIVPQRFVDKDDMRKEAIAKLRAQAMIQGFRITRWQAGQAVEAAYAELNPHKTKLPEA